MAKEVFKEFIEEAKTIFSKVYSTTFTKLVDSVDDLTKLLGEIKQNTARMENDGSIGGYIVISELILELLNSAIQMRAVLNKKDNNIGLKIEKLTLVKDDAINVQKKLEGVILFDSVMREGVRLILTYVDTIKDTYNKFVKQILEVLENELEKGDRKQTGGSKSTKRKSRKTRKAKKKFFGLF